jgi:glycosyltransferase involved in cell wall biosynthesis
MLSARGVTTVAVSEEAAAEVRRFYRVSVNEIIPNGIDTDVFRQRPRAAARRAHGFQENERLALFVGRAEARKAPEVAYEAARRAGFELVVAGPSPIDGGRHLGVMSPTDLATLYSACNCVVFPTRYEACSYVVLEALASGVPLVTTEVGWMRTFLNEVPEYRRLVASRDPIAMAAILEQLDTPPVMNAVQLAHKWTHTHSSVDVFAHKWLKTIKSALHAAGGSQ